MLVNFIIGAIKWYPLGVVIATFLACRLFHNGMSEEL